MKKPIEFNTLSVSWKRKIKKKKHGWIAICLMTAMFLQLTACSHAPAPSEAETGDTQLTTTDTFVQDETDVSTSDEAKKDRDALPDMGEEIFGFTLKSVEPYGPLNAQILCFDHAYSGAQLCYIKNDDINWAFTVAYRTPLVDETDSNHIFEHAILASSQKYPSNNLFFDMVGKTYNTYVNAFTYSSFTMFPFGSQSEEQLLLGADAYLSCMVSPGLLKDPQIFKREALRYMLYDVDEPISMGGTVFSEDMGYMTSISMEGARNIVQGLYPGEYAANYIGRAHANYQDLTFEHVAETHERCYRFDNSLLLLYGDLDYRNFLEFIDREYLSKAEKRGTDLSAYDDPVTAPGYVEEVVYAPAYEGDSAEDASVIYYAMDLDGQEWETLAEYVLLSVMLSSDSSVFHENLKEAGLTAPTFADISMDTAKPFFIFGMVYANPEDAAPFKAVVDKTLAHVAENGLKDELVDMVLKSKALDDHTMLEDSYVILERIFPSICMKWVQTGEADALTQKEAAFLAMETDTDQASIRMLAKSLKNASRSAIVTTVPKPGLAEQLVAEQETYLAEMKAAMTPGELEQMVKDTLAFDQWNASEQSNSDIVISVADLPALEAGPEFHKEEEDGALYYNAACQSEQISVHRLLFDTSAVPQEDLHYISLYSILLEELETENHTKTQKDNLMKQYLHGLDVDVVYPEEGERPYPMFSVRWNCMAEDYETSLGFLLESMEELKVEDKEELMRVLDKYLPSLDWSRSDPDSLNSMICDAGVDRDGQYWEYLYGQRFYEFVKELRVRLDTDPDAMKEIGEKLRSVQKSILHRDRMVVMNVAPQGQVEQVSDISRQMLKRLPSLPGVQADYKLPEFADRTGVIVERSNYCTYSVSDTTLLDNLSGTLFPFLSALSDRYIVPQIRFQGLAYSAGLVFPQDLRSIVTYTYSDPKVAETVAVIDKEAEQLETLELTQEELDSYILNAYSVVTAPTGNLDKYLTAMYQDMTGFDMENWRRLVNEIRTTTLDHKEGAVEMLSRLLDKQHLVTAGNAQLIREEADIFDKVYDYRGPLE